VILFSTNGTFRKELRNPLYSIPKNLRYDSENDCRQNRAVVEVISCTGVLVYEYVRIPVPELDVLGGLCVDDVSGEWRLGNRGECNGVKGGIDDWNIVKGRSWSVGALYTVCTIR